MRKACNIADIVEAQHRQATRYANFGGKNGHSFLGADVATERMLNSCADRALVQQRIARLNRLVTKGSGQTMYWTVPKSIRLGWPLTVNRYQGDCQGEKFGRVQKIVDLTRESMQCVSVVSNEKNRILAQISHGSLELGREEVDLKQVAKLVREWHKQDGVTILFANERETKLVFCICRLSGQ
ncbi:MAG: hypothetical protein M1530_03025 [Candidatus Marsarchaeota archaeon]|nr:hypothetical protein [Candidatus Marsarchaeota archaeon]